MKKNLLILLPFLLCLCACGDRKAQELTYDATALESADVIELSLTDIPSDFLFSKPKQIDFVTDSLLVVFDNYSGSGKLAHLLTKDGRAVGSFGMIGKGHGEMIYPGSISVGEDARSIYFFDWKTSYSIRFMVEDILAGKNAPAIINTMDSLQASYYRLNSLSRFNDKDYIATGYDDKIRIMTVKNDQKLDVYSQYPKLDENEEYTWSLWSNGRFGVSPDRRHFVNATHIGMLFEIFRLDDGKIKSKVLKAFYKPIFGVADGARPACVIWNKETIGGSNTLYCRNKSFFGVIGGKGNTHYNEIYEFDYNGDLINAYKVNGHVVCLAVNPQDEMYLIVMDDDGEQYLKKADLKSL